MKNLLMRKAISPGKKAVKAQVKNNEDVVKIAKTVTTPLQLVQHAPT
jgi:hypothetical protein